MNVDEFLTRYGGTIEVDDIEPRFWLRVGRFRSYRYATPQLCVDAALDDAMDYMAAGLQADREQVEDVREERRAD
jgi:hypothetical protein